MAVIKTTITTAPGFLVALRDLLTARPGLAGVTVSTGPLVDDTIPESIEFDEVLASQDWGALGHSRRKEDYTVSGWIFATQSGSSEDVISAVRDRAFDILAELAAALWDDPTVSQTVQTAQLQNFTLDQAIVTGRLENKRGAGINFNLSVTALLKRNVTP